MTRTKIRSASPKKAKTAGAAKAETPPPAAIEWKIHVPNLISEILCNSGAQALEKPLQILGRMLHEVATRAAEINDPELNILMLRLVLYEASDPVLHSAAEIDAVMKAQRVALSKAGA